MHLIVRECIWHSQGGFQLHVLDHLRDNSSQKHNAFMQTDMVTTVVRGDQDQVLRTSSTPSLQ